jgi:hypothetical protein
MRPSARPTREIAGMLKKPASRDGSVGRAVINETAHTGWRPLYPLALCGVPTAQPRDPLVESRTTAGKLADAQRRGRDRS